MGPDVVVSEDDIVAVLDWTWGKESPDNRQLVSYARAHGFLVESGGVKQSLVVARDKVFLTSVSVGTLRRRLDPNIVSPAGGSMLR